MLHNAELNALYSSPNIISSQIETNEIGRACSTLGADQKCIYSFSGKSRGKETFRCRWEDNITMDLREVGCDPGEWINLAEDTYQWRAYVWAVMNLRVP